MEPGGGVSWTWRAICEGDTIEARSSGPSPLPGGEMPPSSPSDDPRDRRAGDASRQDRSRRRRRPPERHAPASTSASPGTQPTRPPDREDGAATLPARPAKATPTDGRGTGLIGWLLRGQTPEPEGFYERAEQVEHEPQHRPQPWYKVMCLTGVDYFSTLGYQP